MSNDSRFKLTVEGDTYDVDMGTLSIREAIALQRATGYTTKQVLEGLAELDAISFAALVWLAYTRAGNKVDFDSLDFDLLGIGIERVGEPVGSGKAKGKKTT